jgi:hypothetical protein
MQLLLFHIFSKRFSEDPKSVDDRRDEYATIKQVLEKL